MPSVSNLHAAERKKIGVINSGFGFADAPPRIARGAQAPGIAYLGTVDFVKMHPGFFDAIDAVVGDDLRVSVWGEVDAAGAVVARAKPCGIPSVSSFWGRPLIRLRRSPKPTSFFIRSNANTMARQKMLWSRRCRSGSTALVLDNPAEMAIIRDAETGFIATSIEEMRIAVADVCFCCRMCAREFLPTP